VPVSVEKEIDHSTFASRCAGAAIGFLVLVLLFAMGVMQDIMKELVGWLVVFVPAGVVLVLTIVILAPLGRWLNRTTARREGESSVAYQSRTLATVGLIAILAPFAFIIVCATVCAAAMTVMEAGH
jgi:hypothetical protein